MTAVTEKKPSAAARKPRADAERNRRLLLDVAKKVFAEKGADASLEEIARLAGVGIGTLYRHFPTRDDLIAAVYRGESDALAASARDLSERLPPLEALREWMLVFVDYMQHKQAMYPLLNSLAEGTAKLYASSGASIENSITMLTDKAVDAGMIRLNMKPIDLLRAVAAVTTTGSGSAEKAAAVCLVGILVAGLHSAADTPAL